MSPVCLPFRLAIARYAFAEAENNTKQKQTKRI